VERLEKALKEIVNLIEPKIPGIAEHILGHAKTYASEALRGEGK